MADFPGAHIPGLVRELGGQDGSLTVDEAVVQTTGQGLKLKFERRPITINRPDGEVKVGDLPVRFVESTSGKVEQFCDAVQHVKIDVTSDYFQNVIVKECATSNYKGLPEPFRLRKEPMVGYTMQLIILTALPPDDVPADTSEKYNICACIEACLLAPQENHSQGVHGHVLRHSLEVRLGQAHQTGVDRTHIHDGSHER